MSQTSTLVSQPFKSTQTLYSQQHRQQSSSLDKDVRTNSMTNGILAPLKELQTLSQTLFLSLAPTQSKPPPPPLISDFLACDAALSNALELAHMHQIKQRRIETLKKEILDLEQRWREICAELESGRKELAEIVAEGDERIKAIEQAKKGSIPYPELLAYAQSLSAFTSAPPNIPDLSLPGQPASLLFFPPFPNEEKMRRGRLNAEAPLGPLGETHSVGRPPALSPTVPETSQILVPGANLYRQDIRPMQQMFEFDLDLNPD